MIRQAIRLIAKLLGWSTVYHISASHPHDSGSGWSNLSMSMTARPWLHQDNYRELVDFVADQSGNPAQTPTINSITKLGL